MNRASSIFREYLLLGLIILVGIVIRLFFQIGHIFSDDAYYSLLSYLVQYGDFNTNYLGYPVFPLRIGFIELTALSMRIFGTNELATLFFPFLISILNIVLTFKLAQMITKSVNVSLSSAFLMAFFPTDVIFASIGFPDLINVFLINLGIYFLIKSYLLNKLKYAFIGGLSLFASMLFKETAYYFFILLIILFAYYLIRSKKIIFQLLIGMLFILANYFIEGFVYLLLHNDFFYRITITNLNYQFSYYDFFPYTAQKLSGSKDFFRNLFDQIFLVNIKSIFLRRFYLFLPIVLVIQTFFSLKKKENKLLMLWFWGIAILLIIFTTSFTEYKPLDLSRSWYIYPLLMPVVILSAIFINRFSKLFRNGLFAIYILGSLIMCFEYQLFFNKDNLDSLKIFLRENASKNIYTDHFTKYSVDLIREYNPNSKRILGKDFNFDQILAGDWVLFNKKHIEELQMQKYQFPDFSILKTSAFKKKVAFNDFIFYEKLH